MNSESALSNSEASSNSSTKFPVIIQSAPDCAATLAVEPSLQLRILSGILEAPTDPANGIKHQGNELSTSYQFEVFGCC